MTADDFLPLLPAWARSKFLGWLVKHDRRVSLRAWKHGYEHGYHDGQEKP